MTSLVTTILQLALSLLLAVQNNPSAPIAQQQQAIGIATQAIQIATQALQASGSPQNVATPTVVTALIASSSPAASPAAATSTTSAIVWKKGKLSFAIVSASVYPGGPIPCELVSGAGGGCPRFSNIVRLHLTITNSDAISYSASSLPLNVNEVDGSGNMTAPESITFTDGTNQLMSGKAGDVQLDFDSPTVKSSAFETGGIPNLFFLVMEPGNVTSTSCTFPTTSTVCLGEIQ